VRAEEASPAVAAGAGYTAVSEAEIRAFDDRLREPVVGVRKRQELVQEVPGSVSPLLTDTLRRSNIRRIHQLQEHTPNLVYTQFGNTARLALRGIGQPQTLLVSGDSGVGVYIDGIFAARSQDQLPTLFDVDRVEVLRGPQGTLFGTNSPGGAISVVARKPQLDDFGADAALRIGNFDALESRVTLNAPLLDERSALRVSLASVTRDGFSRNVLDGDREDDDKELSARAQLLLLPSDDLEVLLSGYSTRKNHGAPPVKCKLIPASPGAIGAPIFDAAGGSAACAAAAARDDLEFVSDTRFARDDLRQLGGSMQVSWDLGPGLRLKSLTGLRTSRPSFATDADGTELPFFGSASGRAGSAQRQFSQELQLLGDAFGGRLRYIAGLYFFREQARQLQFLRFGFLPTSFVAFVLPGSVPGVDAAQAAQLDLLALGLTPNPERDRALFQVNNLSYAGFGQATYALSDRLDLSVGLRLTHERKRALTRRAVDGCQDGPDVNPVVLQACRSQIGQGSGLLGTVLPGFDRSARFTELSPQASLTYNLSDDLSLYASYATGFRNGGFDLAALLPEQTDEIDPEDITSYELGLKSTWLDRRLLLKASVFSTLQEDVRLAANLVGFGVDGDGNAGDAVLRGGELEMVLLVTERLGLSASLGALRARYSDLRPEFQQLDGERLALAPNYTMSFGVDYRAPVGRLGILGARMAWSHRGSQQNDPSGTDATLAGKYGLLDGRLSLALPDGKTEIAAFGTNLLDRRYFNNAAVSLEFGTATRIFGPPRQYGVEILRSF
jgi:iron complex outermembrane receptor protein